MNAVVQIVLWTVVVVIVLSLIIMAIALRNARDGYEDEGGFHSGAQHKKEEPDVVLETYHIG